jgi:hypothetical protein
MTAGPKLELKNPVFELMEPQLIALNAEVPQHPDLMERLAQQKDKDLYIQINEIAAFLGILLDGQYTYQDILNLCELMTKKLYERRTQIILPLQ